MIIGNRPVFFHEKVGKWFSPYVIVSETKKKIVLQSFDTEDAAWAAYDALPDDKKGRNLDGKILTREEAPRSPSDVAG